MTAENVESGSQTTDHDRELNASIDAFVDVLVEGTEDDPRSGLESFDQHVQKMRDEMHEAMDDFKNTFLKGYELILGELSLHYGGMGGEQAKPPPNAIRI